MTPTTRRTMPLFLCWFVLSSHLAAQVAAVAGLLIGPVTYGILNWQLPQIAFLNHMAITFAIVVSVMAVLTWARPLADPVRFSTSSDIDLTPSRGAQIGGVVVVVATVLLYIVFW